jgi:hypothetical protein
MMRQVLYHTATPDSLNDWIWMAFFIKILEKTLELMMVLFSLLVPTAAFGLEP